MSSGTIISPKGVQILKEKGFEKMYYSPFAPEGQLWAHTIDLELFLKEKQIDVPINKFSKMK